MMEPVDFRNANFEDLQARITGQRMAALSAWRRHGPGTTRQIAERAGIDILTLRPRSTELYQLGFLYVVNETESGHEGIYAARDDEDLRKWLVARHTRECAMSQPELPLRERSS